MITSFLAVMGATRKIRRGSVATLPGQRRLPEVSRGRIAYRGRGGSMPLEPASTTSSNWLAIMITSFLALMGATEDTLGEY